MFKFLKSWLLDEIISHFDFKFEELVTSNNVLASEIIDQFRIQGSRIDDLVEQVRSQNEQIAELIGQLQSKESQEKVQEISKRFVPISTRSKSWPQRRQLLEQQDRKLALQMSEGKEISQDLKNAIHKFTVGQVGK